MRLPGHETHHIEFCEACAVFDQVHAERDDLLLRVEALEEVEAAALVLRRAAQSMEFEFKHPHMNQWELLNGRLRDNLVDAMDALRIVRNKTGRDQIAPEVVTAGE